MENNIIADIIIIFILTCFIGICFMAFMDNLKNKRHFLAGTYLSGIVTFLTLLVKFILDTTNNN